MMGPEGRRTHRIAPAGQRVLAGRYRLEQSQGAEAGMEFHQATDQRDGRPVGVTLFTGRLDESGARRYLDRARPLVAVRHPALVSVLDVGVERGQGFLVRELVEGYTLRAELGRGPLPPDEVARIGARAAAALAEAHDRGLSHRDVSPSTVVLGRDGRTRLAELGVLGLAEITGARAARGSAAYLSPEQVRREPIGPPADVYALGLTLLEALTGRAEYSGIGQEAAAARLTRPPTVPNDVPAPLARALLAMTATAPADRASARESAERLQSAAGGGVAYAAEAPEGPGISPARRVALIAVPVLVALVLIAVVVTFLNSTDNHDSASGATATPTAAPTGDNSPRSTRARTPSTDSNGSSSGPGLRLPDFTPPQLPKASDLERAAKDKVKDQVQRGLTEKVQDAWQSFKNWLASLF